MDKKSFFLKILIIMFIIFLSFNCFKIYAANKLGDVDGDGKVTSADSRLVLRYSIGLEKFNNNQKKAADFDKDGKINSEDARLIMRYSVGLDIYISSITVSVESNRMNVGDSIAIKTVISPSNATNKTITYVSSNTNIATVDSKGIVKGKSGGTVTITAKSSNGKTGECKIEVLDGKIRIKNGNEIDTSKPILIGHKYTNLTDLQIKQLAWIAKREQGSVEGAKIELSLMANLTETKRKDFDIYKYVMYSGWFGSYYSVPSNPQYNSEFTTKYVDAAKSILRDGNRYLPTNVIEHDSISDISRLSTGGSARYRSNYIPNKTIISNVYGARYMFVGFAPNGGDPFGYLVN